MILERSEMQGLVTSAYSRSLAARYVLLSVEDASSARASVRRLTARTTFADRVKPELHPREDRGTRLAVAFSFAGLRALEVPVERLVDFSREFREGMVTPHRQRLLGDVDGSPSDPRRWRWGGPDTPVHVLLALFAPDEPSLDRVVDDVMGVLAGMRVTRTVATVSIAGEREHFGFRDGIASPWVDGLHRPRNPRDRIAAGEILLGYPDLTRVPERHPPLGRNGGYLVVRQLAQDVEGFWAALRARAGNDHALRWAAKMTGRWPDGTPVTLSPDTPLADPTDDFGYADDSDGVRCPWGAHVRRTNPRDGLGTEPADSTALVNRHRLLRRGRAFGLAADPGTWPPGIDPVVVQEGREDASHQRGVLFVCLCASLARQFEFVAHSWMNNPKFGGLYDENDPLAGAPHRRLLEGATGYVFTAPDERTNARITLPDKYVHCIGGAYFFLPGRAALHSIASLSAA